MCKQGLCDGKVTSYLVLPTATLSLQVYDIQQARAREVSTVFALFSVARVKWRPAQRFHIAR